MAEFREAAERFSPVATAHQLLEFKRQPPHFDAAESRRIATERVEFIG